jgi:hypothetical protein
MQWAENLWLPRRPFSTPADRPGNTGHGRGILFMSSEHHPLNYPHAAV